MKKLRELFNIEEEVGSKVVTDLCDDSRQVIQGNLFVVLGSCKENKRKHVEEAIARGAVAVLQEGGNEDHFEIQNDVVFFSTPNVRQKLAEVATKFFPCVFNHVVAVTGTNGKSSVVDILRQIWTEIGINAASIGTLGVAVAEGRSQLPNNMTTPDCIALHKILNKLSANGIKNIAMEATSQGIEQCRIDNISFDVCAFTNLTQDHLNYHKTFENYWNAKRRLFTELAAPQASFIVNFDDPCSQDIRAVASDRRIRCIDYGYGAADVKILEIEQRESNQRVKILFFGREFSFILPFQGTFQVYNSLCSAAIAYLTGTDYDRIIEVLEKLVPISGRLELVAQFRRSARVYVDYAHTPNALQNAILALRSHTKGRIVTVFGCGGNRDSLKRALMGEIAEKFSDVVIVTDDNPRDEDPCKIRKMILEGCPSAAEISDRRMSIEAAIDMLSDGDSLLVAGKGHETHQQVGNKLLSFSDKDIILEKLREIV
ncbi:MAG: UDP-N-acetylmuramoyl-L-alanyl-D-glutamate--2,6-diaminopimelate ligase [Holosporaceae bacterium]|jgi:UDP-N-acetylmuramoyl-L-alanyl-D-glutamate--2,6-diaminopimelate ligase|nr:UDP-N-acetylmuramoyl-L-alanyl-D-glutamate--2,6-diaminopimelate ligase [Holosporaceae bacterium]